MNWLRLNNSDDLAAFSWCPLEVKLQLWTPSSAYSEVLSCTLTKNWSQSVDICKLFAMFCSCEELLRVLCAVHWETAMYVNSVKSVLDDSHWHVNAPHTLKPAERWFEMSLHRVPGQAAARHLFMSGFDPFCRIPFVVQERPAGDRHRSHRVCPEWSGTRSRIWYRLQHSGHSHRSEVKLRLKIKKEMRSVMCSSRLPQSFANTAQHRDRVTWQRAHD